MREKLVSKAFIEFLNTVSVSSTTKSCTVCGIELGNLNRTFFFEGQTWQMPLPICVKCYPIEEVAPPFDA